VKPDKDRLALSSRRAELVAEQPSGWREEILAVDGLLARYRHNRALKAAGRLPPEPSTPASREIMAALEKLLARVL
jgi:hypothetical protein